MACEPSGAGWIGAHNRAVKQGGKGVRTVACRLPTKSPWLNPIEPQGMHGKRRIVELARVLTADEIAECVCACFDRAAQRRWTPVHALGISFRLPRGLNLRLGCHSASLGW